MSDPVGIPSAFLTNSWVKEKGEGVDRYYKAIGTPWAFRKLILASPHKITWKNLGSSIYSIEHQALIDMTFKFRLDEEFITKGIDNKTDLKILIKMEGHTIVERFEQIEKPNDPIEEYRYEITGSKLKKTMKRGDVSCTMIYKKK